MKLADFHRKNRRHLLNLFSIVEYYQLKIDYKDLVVFCYKNSLDYKNGGS